MIKKITDRGFSLYIELAKSVIVAPYLISCALAGDGISTITRALLGLKSAII